MTSARWFLEDAELALKEKKSGSKQVSYGVNILTVFLRVWRQGWKWKFDTIITGAKTANPVYIQRMIFVLQSGAAYMANLDPPLSFENEIPMLSSEIILFMHAGTLIDQYRWKYGCLRLLIVFRRYLGNRRQDPENVDWHVYETTGNCCIKGACWRRIICSGNYTLQFIDEQLTPYYLTRPFAGWMVIFLHWKKHGRQVS